VKWLKALIGKEESFSGAFRESPSDQIAEDVGPQNQGRIIKDASVAP